VAAQFRQTSEELCQTKDSVMRERRVLIVDDDLQAADALARELALHDIQVIRALTVAEVAAIVMSRKVCFDMIIMEATLPDGDGCELCARLRRMGLHQPILILSRAGAPEDIVRGLEAGANDYLAKPFRIASLMARLRAHGRSYQANSYAMLAVGPLQYNPGKRLVFTADAPRPKRLTEKEAALFWALYSATGMPVDRTQLMREVWGDKLDVRSHAVDAMIYRLRQKIEPKPSRPAFLLRLPEGYRLVDPSRPARPVRNAGNELSNPPSTFPNQVQVAYRPPG
jgi:DNA-binding response OmpR family regulator